MKAQLGITTAKKSKSFKIWAERYFYRCQISFEERDSYGCLVFATVTGTKKKERLYQIAISFDAYRSGWESCNQ